MTTTKVTLQIMAKNNMDVCVVNAAENSLRDNEASANDLSSTYCRIIHNAIYDGDIIVSDKEVPASMVSELTYRMNTQIVPALVSKDITCQDFFAVRDVTELKEAYGELPLYTFQVSLDGCLEAASDL